MRVFRLVPVVDANEEFNTDDGKMATAPEFFHTERGGVYYTAEVESLLWRAGQLARNDFGGVVSDKGWKAVRSLARENDF